MKDAKVFSYVRFSTPEQIKGTSLERQTAYARRVADEKGLHLDDELSFSDLGKSAYRGDHLKGSLGVFLEMCESGAIPKGSILVVESFDRLSRDKIQEAAHLMYRITAQGIKIITASDGKEYTHESDLGDYLYAIIIMSRAHEESEMKSKRLKEARRIAREKLWKGEKKVFTKQVPKWIKPSADGSHLEIIPERIAIIREIFEKKLRGCGPDRIARDLNTSGVGWVPKNGWRSSYINKILRNRAVIGEFQPHIGNARKRKPIGEPIKNYYPRAIDDELFYQVQEHMHQNRGNGGRTGKNNNIFMHVAKCGYCGSSMHFVDKGKTPKGRQYLVCGDALRGHNCKAQYYLRYDELEKTILSYCKGLDVADILPNSEQTYTKLNLLSCQKESLNGELRGIEQRIDNIKDSIELTSDRELRADFMSTLETRKAEREEVIQKIRAVEQEMDKLSHVKEEVENHIETLNELYSLMSSCTEDEIADIRKRLNLQLKKLIDKIEIFPMGLSPCTKEEFKKAIKESTDWYKKVHPELTRPAIQKELEKSAQRAVIHFKNGSRRRIQGNLLSLDIDHDTNEIKMLTYHDGKTLVAVEQKDGRPFYKDSIGRLISLDDNKVVGIDDYFKYLKYIESM